MSATELIERYSFTSISSDFIEGDIQRAQRFVMWAAESRINFPNPKRENPWYSDLSGEAIARGYMGQARAIGWHVAQMIDHKVRAEMATAAREVAAGEWSQMEPACGDETCEDCERPMWHHLVGRTHGVLCPLGRRFWQIARELDAACATHRYGSGLCTVRAIAARK